MSGDFFAVAVAGGILAFLTPCVFPMVPVTLAYFGKGNSEHPSPSRAGWFALGIISSFTILGLAVALVFGASSVNRFAADPRVNLALAAIFVFFALNLFGLFELSLPSSWMTRAVKSTQDTNARSAGGAALLGAVFAVTSLTCTAPFVGSLLVMAARGEWTLPFTGMLLFSAAFALPFYLLARVPRLLERLPRAGDWIHALRVCVGIVEIAAAIKFVANADIVSNWGVVTRQVVIVSWAVLAAAIVLYLFMRAIRGRSRGYAIAGLFALGVVSAVAAGASRGDKVSSIEPYLPPVRTASEVQSTIHGQWILNDLPKAQALAARSGKLVFIDFTGYTCTNCRWMESNIFNRADVGAELSRFELARLYTDGEGKIYEDQQAFQEKQFGTVALPLYAIVTAEGRPLITQGGVVRDSEKFIGFLRAAYSPIAFR